MADIVREIQKIFRYDHIGIGIMDYATKDIEIKAEAGTTSQTLGRRVALGTGVLGKVARTRVSAWCRMWSRPVAGCSRNRAPYSAYPSVMANTCWACLTWKAALRTLSRHRMS